jgi:hypothetical protein
VASADQDRRNEFAQEHGFDSYYQYQRSYRETRDAFEERGMEVGVSQIQEATFFAETFDPTDNDLSRQELRDWFDEYVGGSDQDFWDWLGDLYSEM